MREKDLRKVLADKTPAHDAKPNETGKLIVEMNRLFGRMVRIMDDIAEIEGENQHSIKTMQSHNETYQVWQRWVERIKNK
jgi:hypothetical protein